MVDNLADQGGRRIRGEASGLIITRKYHPRDLGRAQLLPNRRAHKETGGTKIQYLLRSFQPSLFTWMRDYRPINRASRFARGGLRVWFKRGDARWHTMVHVRCSRFLTALAQFHSNRSRLIHGVQFNPDLSATPLNTLLTPSSPIIHILNCQSLLDAPVSD